jgi:hypothetical protein
MESPDGACASRPHNNDSLTSSPAAMWDDAEPSTQPMTTDDDSMDLLDDSQEPAADVDPNIWGYLIPLLPRGKLVAINKKLFTVGRSVKSSHVVSNKDNETISKFHFDMVKGEGSQMAYVVDRSSNGTFVNERKVGKGKRAQLAHNAYISMTGPKLRNFVYLSANREFQKQYPPALRRKYHVSRELGKGACGTVYLGVRREDEKQVAIKAIDRSKVSMMPGGGVGAAMNEVRLLQAIDHPCVIR